VKRIAQEQDSEKEKILIRDKLKQHEDDYAE